MSFLLVFLGLIRAESFMKNAGRGQNYSEVMSYVPSWFCKPEFYGSQNIDSKGDSQCAALWSIIEQHCPLLYVTVLTNLPLMVMPSSTPLLLGSLTWKVPLLGTTDSEQK